MNLLEIISLISTIVTFLAVIVALFGARLWQFIDKPRLEILFKLEPPYCHKTGMGNDKIPVYYFRFIVKNIGKTQAEDCEVFLESIKRKVNGEFIFYKNFTPVNLKWSGIRESFKRTIFQGKEMYCDLGKIMPHAEYYLSQYVNVTPEEQLQNKFVFELPETYYSQWDCLLVGEYIITVSVYSKNTNKITRDFRLSWTGVWRDEDTEMFKELNIV